MTDRRVAPLPEVSWRQELLTEINGLYRIFQALRQGCHMVRNSTRLLLAIIAFALMNQASAGNGGLQTAPAPGMSGLAGARTLPGEDPGQDFYGAPASGISPTNVSSGGADVSGQTRSGPAVTYDGTPGSARPDMTSSQSNGPASGDTEAASTATPDEWWAGSASSDSVQIPIPAALPSALDDGGIGLSIGDYEGPGSTAAARLLARAGYGGSVYKSLWDRVRAGFKLPELDTPLVRRYEDWYADRPDYLERIVDRGKRYLHFIVEEVEKRHMPTEIALLPMIESAYNPTAYSKAHASGMWQFIPATGRIYGLEQNWWYDGRRDVLAATRAALDYLQKLHDQFGDWELALAAYNWGEGAVTRAIERNRRRGRPTDYSSLRMPAETRSYVPKLLAVKNIVADPEKFGMSLDDVPNEPYFIRVAAPGNIDFKRVAQLAEVPVEELKSLNPAFNRPVITPTDGQTLLLPADKAEVFAENLKTNDRPLVSWQAYKVHRAEKLSTIARRFSTTVALLKQVNGIKRNGRLKPGSTLLVPKKAGTSVDPKRTARIDVQTFKPPVVVGEYRYHRVRRGETLSGIAHRYGVSVSQLSAWNNLKGHLIRAGQRLRLHTYPRSHSKSRRHHSRRTARRHRSTRHHRARRHHSSGSVSVESHADHLIGKR
ncbi:MAG: transglycosylase SLT domain-containing protein [Betaproteobacteria bacterium]|nr:transglycosylase SLT domain-containing protein [Betaproteobacteria bacterium]